MKELARPSAGAYLIALLCVVAAWSLVAPYTTAAAPPPPSGQAHRPPPPSGQAHRQPPPSGCVFRGAVDEAAVDRVLRSHWREPALQRWDAQIAAKTATLTLHTVAGQRVLTLRLGASCAAPPTVRLTGGSEVPVQRQGAVAAATPANLIALARALPLPRAGAAIHSSERGPSSEDALPVLLLIALICGLLGTSRRVPTAGQLLAAFVALAAAGAWLWLRTHDALTPADRLPRPFLHAAVAAVVLVAAVGHRLQRDTALLLALLMAWALTGLAVWPVLHLPFESDATMIRVTLGLVDPFADHPHPFLPLALTKAMAFGSLEPSALRHASVLFVLLEVVLLVVAAGKRAGVLAATLAAIWLVSDVWHRPGLADVSDWNIAGAALLSWLIWLRAWQERQRASTPTSPKQWGLLATLMTWGMLCSYLMIIPAAVLVFLVVLPTLRAPPTDPDQARTQRLGLIGISVLLLAGIIMVGVVFWVRLGEGYQAPSSTAELLRGMWTAWPVGRTRWMLIPLIAGGILLVQRRREATSQFLMLTTLAIVAALIILRPITSIGAFYVTLVTPLWIELSAVAVAEFVQGRRAATAATPSAPKPVSNGVVSAATTTTLAVALALLVALTAPLTHGPRGWGEDRWSRFGQVWLQEPLPIQSGVMSLEFWLTYERMRVGRITPQTEDELDVAFQQDREKIYRWHPEKPGCEVDWPPVGRPYYFVHGSLPNNPDSQACKARLLAHCKPLFPAPTEPLAGMREMGVYRCER